MSANEKCSQGCVAQDGQKEILRLSIFILQCHMAQAFKVMNETHPELRSFKKSYRDRWEAKSKNEATLFLNILRDFEFIVRIIIFQGLDNSSLCVTTACPFSKYFQLLYIFTQIFKYFALFQHFFALFLKNHTHALTF